MTQLLKNTIVLLNLNPLSFILLQIFYLPQIINGYLDHGVTQNMSSHFLKTQHETS